MSTGLAAVTFLDGQRSAGPVHRAILAVDLEGSTQRTDPVKGELRRVMYDLLARALAAVAITGDRLEPLIDRGDGVLVLIRPHDDVPKTILLDRLVPLLATLLAEHNARAAEPALRIRLRAVVHAGEVHEDGRGFYGEAIDVAIRLLDSRSVKRALKQAAAPLVLVVSDAIYAGIVCHGELPADPYLPLRVSVGSRRQRGWVHIPRPATSAGITRLPSTTARRAHPAHPRFRASAVRRQRAARSGHR
ncbi:MAG TPA: hypothetical protein VHZ33_31700 [Trebonia sp.]|jgi:hypothetical protein|nr:hypothetical protein [Trebonia sp.]